jgi:uncharacterized Ntn-hydrolase superfamily protein
MVNYTSCTSTSTSEGRNVNIGKQDENVFVFACCKGDNAEATQSIANVKYGSSSIRFCAGKGSYTSMEFPL